MDKTTGCKDVSSFCFNDVGKSWFANACKKGDMEGYFGGGCMRTCCRNVEDMPDGLCDTCSSSLVQKTEINKAAKRAPTAFNGLSDWISSLRSGFPYDNAKSKKRSQAKFKEDKTRLQDDNGYGMGAVRGCPVSGEEGKEEFIKPSTLTRKVCCCAQGNRASGTIEHTQFVYDKEGKCKCDWVKEFDKVKHLTVQGILVDGGEGCVCAFDSDAKRLIRKGVKESEAFMKMEAEWKKDILHIKKPAAPKVDWT
jgi:hypothetical protein